MLEYSTYDVEASHQESGKFLPQDVAVDRNRNVSTLYAKDRLQSNMQYSVEQHKYHSD